MLIPYNKQDYILVGLLPENYITNLVFLASYYVMISMLNIPLNNEWWIFEERYLKLTL